MDTALKTKKVAAYPNYRWVDTMIMWLDDEEDSIFDELKYLRLNHPRKFMASLSCLRFFEQKKITDALNEALKKQ